MYISSQQTCTSTLNRTPCPYPRSTSQKGAPVFWTIRTHAYHYASYWPNNRIYTLESRTLSRRMKSTRSKSGEKQLLTESWRHRTFQCHVGQFSVPRTGEGRTTLILRGLLEAKYHDKQRFVAATPYWLICRLTGRSPYLLQAIHI